MVGKYTGLSDSYLSVLKALQHAALAVSRKLVVNWIGAEDLELANEQMVGVCLKYYSRKRICLFSMICSRVTQTLCEQLMFQTGAVWQCWKYHIDMHQQLMHW